jgi:ABC-type nitrate/sulfonate/bicarbonate transport system substrate-binding protein
MDSIRRSPRKLLTLLAVTGLMVGACSSSASGAPTQSAAGAAGASAAAAPSTAAASMAAAGSTTAMQFPAPEVTTLRIGVSAPTEVVQFAETLADKLGYYKDMGFTSVTVTGLEGDGKVVSALVAGGLDVGVVSASAVLTTVGTDVPLKIVAMNSVKNTDSLVCQKSIKTAADVKGKVVAVSTFGGTSHGSVIQSLTTLGLSSSDVTITQIGNEGTRIAALKGGSIGCAPVGDELNAQMKALGFNILTDLASSTVEWGRSGLAFPVSFMTKYPNATLDIVAAVLKAQNYIYTNTADVYQPFADFSGQKPADAKVSVDAFVNVYGGRGMGWTDQALTIPQQVLGTVNPAVKTVDVTKAEDRSLLQKLWDDGYYKQIGDPDQPFK